jgi:hypothetical protein
MALQKSLFALFAIGNRNICKGKDIFARKRKRRKSSIVWPYKRDNRKPSYHKITLSQTSNLRV